MRAELADLLSPGALVVVAVFAPMFLAVLMCIVVVGASSEITLEGEGHE